MIPLLGAAEPRVAAGLTAAAERCVAEGATAPPWIAVQDRDGRWLRESAGRAVAERRRAVAAVTDEDGLAASIRLGIGGATWLPASTASMAEALRAAAAETRVAAGEVNGLEAVETLASSGEPWHAVGFVWAGFWRAQVGPGLLADLLRELVHELGAPAAVVPGPAVVVAGSAADRIERAWHVVAGRHEILPLDGIAVAEGERIAGGGGWSEALASAVRALSVRDVRPAEGAWSPRPVAALPGGGGVGRWTTAAAGTAPPDLWLARPVADGARWSWTLQGGGDGAGRVVEVLSAAEVQDACGARAARVPGWASLGAMAGSPQGLLVSRLARAAATRGLPLWVANVDAPALRVLLTLGAELWVDGPAVPG